jgi:hypothetical protein
LNVALILLSIENQLDEFEKVLANTDSSNMLNFINYPFTVRISEKTFSTLCGLLDKVIPALIDGKNETKVIWAHIVLRLISANFAALKELKIHLSDHINESTAKRCMKLINDAAQAMKNFSVDKLSQYPHFHIIIKAKNVFSEFISKYKEAEFDPTKIDKNLRPDLLSLIGKSSIIKKILNSENIDNLKNFNHSVINYLNETFR